MANSTLGGYLGGIQGNVSTYISAGTAAKTTKHIVSNFRSCCVHRWCSVIECEPPKPKAVNVSFTVYSLNSLLSPF